MPARSSFPHAASLFTHLPSLGAAFLVAALGSAGCGADDAVKKGAATAIDPAEQARIDQGRKLIDEANRAINDRKYDNARKFLKEADELHIESQHFEVEETTEKLDKRQAKLWSNEVDEKIKGKDCLGAFKELAEPIAKLQSDAFTRELRRLVAADAAKCVQTAVDEKVIASAYADARKLLAAPEVVAVLGPTPTKKAAAELDATLLDALRGQIADDLKSRKWTQAVDKIESAAKKGDATEEDVAALLAAVREGAVSELTTLVSKAIGQRDAPAALRQANALIKVLRWEAGATTVAAEPMPETLSKKHQALSIWVEAQRAGLKIIKTPEARWAHGKVGVSPPSQIDGPAKRDIAHGAKVWILGTAKDKALLLDSDPAGASLVQLLDKAIGWGATAKLVKDDTIDWLVPNDQLEGQRVWGPLRAPDPMYELGVVTMISGQDISVKRYADDRIVKLTRRQLRSGRLGPGTKVITFCTAKDQPAQVMEIPLSRGVKLKCDGGQEKEEVLASLRSKAELLPPTK